MGKRQHVLAVRSRCAFSGIRGDLLTGMPLNVNVPLRASIVLSGHDVTRLTRRTLFTLAQRD